MPPIYVSTTPGRYLQPANKLIHYSTEQSSSLLCLGSFTSLLGSRPPTASLFLRDFSGNFARDSVKPLSRSVAETMIRRDLLVAATAESAAPSNFRTEQSIGLHFNCLLPITRKRSIKHGIICVFYRCNNVSYLFLSRSLVYTCISSSIIHGATLSNVCCFTFAEAESFPFFLDSSCPLSFLRRSNNSFIHPQQRVRWSWNIKMYEQFSARTSAFSF